jgi:predicted transcriptional regulator
MVEAVERTQIYLSEEQQRELERRAAASGRTKSELIREALDEFLGLGMSGEEWRRRWLKTLDEVAGSAPYLPPGDEYAQELREASRARREELERRWRG